MLVETRLIVLHIDFASGNHKCLLDDDGGLPTMTVPDLHQPIQCGPLILAEYLEVDPGWVAFHLVDVEAVEDDGTEILYVYYTCMVPAILNNFKGQWVEVGKINDDKGYVQKMVYEAGQKLLARF